jgi:hypothetical protein
MIIQNGKPCGIHIIGYTDYIAALRLYLVELLYYDVDIRA